MDFPFARPNRPVISPFSIESLGANKLPGFSNGFTASLGWDSANRAVFIPLRIASPYPVRLLWWANGTAVAGNVDVGVYTADATPTLLISAGSTAQATVSVCQSVAVSPTFLLLPGRYYLAMVMSSTSGTRVGVTCSAGQGKMMGMAEMATALPLPATATLTTLASIGSVPMFGISSRTII